MERETFFKNIAKFSVASWLNFIIGILAVVLGTRIFSPEVYGLLDIFNRAANMIVTISCLGLNTAMLRFFYEPPEGWDSKRLFAVCIMIPVAFLVTVGFVLLPFYREISSQIFQRENLYLVFLLWIKALALIVLGSFFSQYYRMMNDSKRYTFQGVVTRFFSQMFVVLSIIWGTSEDIVLSFSGLGIFVWMLVWFSMQRRSVFPEHMQFSFHGFRPVMRFALLAYPSSLLVPIVQFLISVIVVQLVGRYELGILASANFIVAAFTVIQEGFRTYWAAFMYRHYRDELDYIVMVHNYVIIFLFLLLVFFIVGQHGIYFFIGTEFQDSRMFFSLSLISPMLILWVQTTHYGTTIQKKMEQNLIISVIVSVLNILLSYFWLPLYGIIGIAAAGAVAGTAEFCLLTWRGQIYYRSVESYTKSTMGLMLLLALAVSNCLFWEQYWIEMSVVLLLSVPFYIVYRTDFQRGAVVVRDLIRKKDETNIG